MSVLGFYIIPTGCWLFPIIPAPRFFFMRCGWNGVCLHYRLVDTVTLPTHATAQSGAEASTTGHGTILLLASVWE
jgi:hypothetical protein